MLHKNRHTIISYVYIYTYLVLFKRIIKISLTLNVLKSNEYLFITFIERHTKNREILIRIHKKIFLMNTNYRQVT